MTVLSAWFVTQVTMGSPPARPELGIATLGDGRVELRWMNAPAGLVLERTDSLATPIQWRAVAESPQIDGERRVLRLSPSNTGRFFRLRSGGGVVTKIAGTSPANLEEHVAVIRETVVRFSGPLAIGATIPPDNFYAEFGGRRLLSRVELSGDRRTATLFYLEPLPGSARVNVSFVGTGVADSQGSSVDADGDGQPGGTFRFAFSTLGTTALAGTEVIGRVYASELGDDGTNQPLAEVTITVDGAEETLRATTDATGFFRLAPAPVGEFFVKIDGRTAQGSQYPNGAC
jgi:hypothetical protein